MGSVVEVTHVSVTAFVRSAAGARLLHHTVVFCCATEAPVEEVHILRTERSETSCTVLRKAVV